jgi:hypothetical protein
MSILLIWNLITLTLTVRPSIIAIAGVAIDDVRYATMTMLFINSSLRYYLLMANMIMMHIFLGNWPLNKNLYVFEFPENARVRATTSEFTDFASVWWVEYGKKHLDDIPQIWIALKWVMQARFVPSYYARDLINKLQQLKQGAKHVEEYYQELQIGMLHCNLEEREDAAMARFVASLNHKIQDILEYKDYTNITCLFHFACKAEREVQGRHTSAKTIFLQEQLIHGNATMDVRPHHHLHQIGWHLLRPTTTASLKLLPQIQQLGRPQQQRVPHQLSSLLHLQAEQETYNVTAAKGLDMLCVIVPPSVFWS